MVQSLAQDPTYPNGRNALLFVGTIARTDTTAKILFTLPAGCIPTVIRYTSPAASNAATTAVISVGKSGGSGVEYITTADVKTAATGAGQVFPNGPAASLLGQVATASQTVTGIYAETGAASNTGGPWTVILEAIT